jgi:hypothetical protein
MARRISKAASIGMRLADEAYMSWCTAQIQCQNALGAWFDAGPRDRAEANYAYRAALDREQAAAHDLECLSHLAHAASGLVVAQPRAGGPPRRYAGETPVGRQ